jgi:ribosome-associated toxin RatA of RatAB toxin-antitoxin module
LTTVSIWDDVSVAFRLSARFSLIDFPAGFFVDDDFGDLSPMACAPLIGSPDGSVGRRYARGRLPGGSRPCEDADVERRTHSSSVIVPATPEAVYDLVSDVTRTGEWSPQCRACWWDEGNTARVGAWFTGRNEVPGRTWETRSQVIAADRGREFAWEVGQGYVRWAFTMEPAGEGTRLTESWEFLPAGIAFSHERYGEAAERQIADRTRAAHEGIPATLEAIRRIAEGTG